MSEGRNYFLVACQTTTDHWNYLLVGFFSYLFHSSPCIFHVSSRTKFCFDTTGATHRALAAWVEGGFSWNTPESMHGGATGTQVVWPRGFLNLLPALVPSLFRPLVLPAPLLPCASFCPSPGVWGGSAVPKSRPCWFCPLLPALSAN